MFLSVCRIGQLTLCRSPSAHVGTIRNRILFTHIGVSELIFAKYDGLSIIRKTQDVFFYFSIVALVILKNYIREQEPGVGVIMVCGWPQEKVDRFGGWEQFLRKKGYWEPGKNTIFIFDEAQESYGDTELWGQIFKDFRGFSVLFIIAFASYGSPTSENSPSYSSPASSIHVHHPPVRHTPVFVSDWQRVMLRPIDH